MNYTITTTSTLTAGQLDILANELGYMANIMAPVNGNPSQLEEVPNPVSKIDFVVAQLDAFIKNKSKELYLSAERKALLVDVDTQLAGYSAVLDTNIAQQIVTEVE